MNIVYNMSIEPIELNFVKFWITRYYIYKHGNWL